MFKIDSETKQIKITRGDIGRIEVSVKNDDDTDYVFQIGDVVRLSVFKQNNCKSVVLKKSVTAENVGTTVSIDLTKEDTKIGEIISKPVNYWYEICLNPDTEPQTIIGYDDDPVIFRLLPEGADEE